MLEMIARGIPRQGYEIHDDSNNAIGLVTSGTVAPWIEKNVAMAYVSPAHSEIGKKLFVTIRNRSLQCHVVPRPFFKR
ncbi:MAG: glycine cleavage T C-terminal barrel domain-containing protein, partial [Candidatus Latescibacteria bacterium]|nr:glycine cleavage T C-terminal barrel domain-containing protein [Candidatus Latescibacterota bacterium]